MDLNNLEKYLEMLEEQLGTVGFTLMNSAISKGEEYGQELMEISSRLGDIKEEIREN